MREGREGSSISKSGWPAWDSVGVTVQPGCTNLGLGTLLHSRTKADDDGRMGCSQARAQDESKSSMASGCPHTYTRRTYGEYQ